MLVKDYLRISLLTLLMTAGSVALWAAPLVMPQKQAVHFCHLMVCDNEDNVCPLSAFIRQQPLHRQDSLSIEQLFMQYVFDYKGWQTLRIFPHQLSDNRLVWYAPADQLPQDMNVEHQKYIHEVFPRLIAEIEAGNWDTVDAYIDRMIQYQCRFGGTAPDSSTSLPIYLTILIVIVILLVVIFVIRSSHITNRGV